MDKVSPFQVSIPRYKEVPDGKKTAVFYLIDIQKIGSEKWTLEKRYREFDDLQTQLKKTHGNLPSLPGKSLLPLKEPNEIENRRQELEKYLTGVCSRTDLISSDPVKRFLQIDNFAPETTVTPPKMIYELPGLVLGVRDFTYEVKEGLLFTAISDMSVTSRVDSYLTNMKMPWEKEVPKASLVTVGAVECYLKNQKDDEFKFDRLWTKTFQYQVICMHWDSSSCQLIVGEDDGSVVILKVSSELGFVKYDEVNSYKLHLARVMGIWMDPITQYIYTIGEDKKFKVYDPNKNDVVSDNQTGTSLLTALACDKENKRAFVSNRSAQVYIYDISSKVPKFLHYIQAHSKGAIRGLFFDPYKNYLFTGNYDDGVIAIWDLQKPGKEKYASNIANLSGKKGVRCVVWSTGRYELYSGCEDGTLTFWDAKKISPLYAMKSNTDGICKIQWVETQNLLLTGGKDKKLRFYQLPDEWRDKRLEAEIMKESRLQQQQQNIQKFQEIQQKRQDDSDEDDLAGWHK